MTTPIKINEIEIKKQVRLNYDQSKIDRLKNSINKHGLIHPISVRSKKTGYEIVCGHRRFIACKQLKWEAIEAIIYSEEMTSLQIRLIQLEENDDEKREGNTPEEYELAVIDLIKIEGLTQAQVSRQLGKKPDVISKIVKAGEVRRKLRELDIWTDALNLPTTTLAELTGCTDDILKEIMKIAFDIKKTSQAGIRQIKKDLIEEKKRAELPIKKTIKKKVSKKQRPVNKKTPFVPGGRYFKKTAKKKIIYKCWGEGKDFTTQKKIIILENLEDNSYRTLLTEKFLLEFESVNEKK